MRGPTQIEAEERAVRAFPALGTNALVATDDPDAIDRAERILRCELEAIDRACSRFRPDSEVSALLAAHGRPVRVSALFVDALVVALEVAARTAGAVDPTVGAAVVSLGYDRDFETVPRVGPGLVAPRRPAPGWWRVEVDAIRRTVRLPEGVLLDLGSTAKAFCADRAAARIADATKCGVLVNLGGDISIAGPKVAPGWTVGVARDSATPPEAAAVAVRITSGGLASSATTVRTWRRGGRLLHHIVDPLSGDVAASSFELVSVAGPSCVDANAVSTAAIVWGATALERVASSGLPARLQRVDGPALVVNGWPPDARRADCGRA